MYLQLGLSHKVVRLLIREQGLDSPDRLRVFCNVVRKPDGKNADRKPDRGKQVSVMSPTELEASCLPIPS